MNSVFCINGKTPKYVIIKKSGVNYHMWMFGKEL